MRGRSCCRTHPRTTFTVVQPHLAAISPKVPLNEEAAVFPFSVPVIRSLREIEFTSPVTFFVGENGSGKSTLLEAIAAAAGLATVGSDDLATDQTLDAQRRLARTLRLSWRKRTRRGFFLRAEDFFGFTKRIAQMRSDFLRQAAEVEAEYRAQNRSGMALGLALGPLLGSVRDMESRYGVDLDANSHGQSFLKLFRNRFVPGGLYLLDEPEAPLSPQSQLALIAMLGDMTSDDSQFIIATHSPILLAYPGATIYSFDSVPAARLAYDELEHVNLTRDFLNGPERFLRHL
jgi:predicted ATPase